MPKIVDHEERRTTIAAAAAMAIAADGIEAVTMKGIAERAGVTTGAVTHYFADKDEVVLEAVLFVGASMTERFEAALASEQPLSEALLAALPHDAESRRDWTVCRVFNDRASRSPSLLEHFRASAEGSLRMATEALGARSGPNVKQVNLDAEVVVATFDAIGDAASADPVSWPTERQRRVVEHLLARLAEP
jgi:TetR/AcrR family transcriptional repressor of bet genes